MNQLKILAAINRALDYMGEPPQGDTPQAQSVRDVIAKLLAAREEIPIGSVLSKAEAIAPIFWRRSQYATFEEAKENGGVYLGTNCYGYTAFADSMQNAASAAECLDGCSVRDDLMVFITADGVTLGSYPIARSYQV
jgi:hypothetical protein